MQTAFKIEKNGDGFYHDEQGHPFKLLLPNEVSGTVPDRLQPHNLGAERATLGSLLIDPDAIIRVASFLHPADFYITRHGWLFEAIRSLHDKQQGIDFVTICDELERRDQLEEAGGETWLLDFINASPTSIHVEYYARIVERTAVLRRLIVAAGQIAEIAYRDDIDAENAREQAEEIIFKVSDRTGDLGATPIRSAVEELHDQIEILSQSDNKVIGIPTGLTDLDLKMGGLQRSDMIVLAGRPGMGKTSLALSIALQAAQRHQKRIAIFSLEMSKVQLAQRLVASLSGIDSQRLRLGDIKDAEWPAYLEATNLLSKLPIFLDDTPAISAFELRARSRRLYVEHGLDLLIVDYIQLMRGDKGGKQENRQQEVSYISRSIKALARELNIPVLALSQLSRKCEERQNKRPIPSDLRDSGSIEQDADSVIFLYRDEVYNKETEFPDIAEIILNKQRLGPTGVFSAYFKKHLAQFVDLETRSIVLEQV